MRNAIELLMAAIALACLGMTSMAAEPDLAGHTSASHSLALQRSVDNAVAKTLARTWNPPLQAQRLAVSDAIRVAHSIADRATDVTRGACQCPRR